MDTIPKEAAKLDRLLRRTQAAKYVTDTYGFPCSPRTLAKLACVSSRGPPFRLAGRIPLYPIDGLDTWAQSKIGPLVRSTSEVRRPGRLLQPADHGRERSVEQPERQ